MTLNYAVQGRTLILYPDGELDHHRARHVMDQMDKQIDLELPNQLILDLSQLGFTDSSGIAVLLRASRRMAQIGGSVLVRAVPAQAQKVFRAAGLERIIRFE